MGSVLLYVLVPLSGLLQDHYFVKNTVMNVRILFQIWLMNTVYIVRIL